MKHPSRRFTTVVALVCAAALFACGSATGETGRKSSAAPGTADLAPDDKVAAIGDWSITLAELDDAAAAKLLKVRQQEFDVRQKVLDQLMQEQLLDKEAKARGITPAELLQTEVTVKVVDPSQAEIDSYYDRVKARVRGQTKDQVAPQIVATLRAQKSAALQQEFIKALRAKYKAKVWIDPPRVKVSVDDDASRGPKDAPITIVEFSDFQCPYCSTAEKSVEAVLKKYGDKVRLVYRDYPMSFHPNAEIASIGSECAEEQGKFWEMHKAMFADQKKLSSPDLIETAGGIGLNTEEFKECLDSGRYKAEVQKDFEDGQRYGVTGTPAFFINGIMVNGAQPPEAFHKIIDAELARLDR